MTTRDKLVSELTQLDARKRVSDRHWNRYFIGLALQAVDRWEEDIAAGMSEAEAFAENFTPTRETNTVQRRLGFGFRVERGRWILPDGRTV
jgi:hypothetical protein